MEFSDAFILIAEIAIAIAGFMGIIAVLGKAEAETNEQFWRVLQSFLQCTAIIIGVLLPYTVAEFGFTEATVWRTPKLFLGIAYPMILSLGIYTMRTGRMNPPLPKVSYTIALITLTVSLLLLASGFGILIPNNASMLMAALLWYLVLALYSFLAALRWALK